MPRSPRSRTPPYAAFWSGSRVQTLRSQTLPTMTLTGMKKHIGVLEQAGLVNTEKVGRVRTCKLGLCRLEEQAASIEKYRQLWDVRFDELDKVVEELIRRKKVDGRKKESERKRTLMKNRTTVERKSERELVVTRTFNGPARIIKTSPPGSTAAPCIAQLMPRRLRSPPPGRASWRGHTARRCS